MTAELTGLELEFLRRPPFALARIATVDPHGTPHVVPGGWRWDEAAGELVLGGRDVPATRRAGHVRRTGVAAAVIDGVDTSNGWAPWGLSVSGPAQVDEDEGAIRIRPTRVSSWGLETVIGRDPGAP